MKRRAFLRGSGGVAAWTMLSQWPSIWANGADAAAPRPKFTPEQAKVMAELELTQARYYNVPRADGEYLHLMAKVSRARRVLEIGTANGYSAIWLALALEMTDGSMVTIELNPELVRAARANLKRAGLDRRIEFKEGDAHQIVNTVNGPFDLVFIDAELGGKMDYFRKIYPGKLNLGGLIMVHNAIKYKSAMQEYLDFIRQHPDFDTVILSLTMEDGFAVSYRRS